MMLLRSLRTPSASPNLKIVVMMILRTSCASSCCSFVAGFGLLQIGDVGGVEGAGDLGVEVDAVHHDQHRGVLQAGCRRSFCAANTISSDLPEPWKCQIRPFLG